VFGLSVSTLAEAAPSPVVWLRYDGRNWFVLVCLVCPACDSDKLSCCARFSQSERSSRAAAHSSRYHVWFTEQPRKVSAPTGSHCLLCCALGLNTEFPTLVVGWFHACLLCLWHSCGDTCAICLESWKPTDEVSKFEPCGHLFHSGCISEWMRRKDTCAVCRAKVWRMCIFVVLELGEVSRACLRLFIWCSSCSVECWDQYITESVLTAPCLPLPNLCCHCVSEAM
jgi:Ring finger domain